MLVVSLTGGIASGKSTASKIFQDEFGVKVIDLDVLAREVVEKDDSSRTLEKLVKRFGEDILQPDGTLDRPALGRKAFGRGKENEKKALNAITHSAIQRRTIWILLREWLTGTPYVIIDTPLSVEAGLWRLCGEMLLVYCTYDQQLERMMKRDADKGLTREDAEDRLSSQLSLDAKRPYADVILENSKDDVDNRNLREQIKAIHSRWHRQHASGFGKIRTLITWLIPPIGILAGAVAMILRTLRVRKRLGEQQRVSQNK